jgi:hypothetical protein
VKTLVSLVPLGLGLAVFGALVWYMVDRDMVVGIWLLAAFLVAHGLVHLMFVAPQPTAQARARAHTGTEYPFDLRQSWLVRAVHLNERMVRGIGVGLMAVVVLGFVAAGLSTIGLLVPVGWWPALVLGATVASLALLAIEGAPGLALGVAIDVALLWIVVVAAWAP